MLQFISDSNYCLQCLELYTVEEGVPKVGFYSLEMAADLELNPKQYHVIAFEDAGDSKNFCYILQAHMDMLGSGKAFVVARPPKVAKFLVSVFNLVFVIALIL